jgi:hypothetical protein
LIRWSTSLRGLEVDKLEMKAKDFEEEVGEVSFGEHLLIEMPRLLMGGSGRVTKKRSPSASSASLSSLVESDVNDGDIEETETTDFVACCGLQ